MTPRLRPVPGAIVLLATILGATGCPGLLDDDYRKIDGTRDSGETASREGGAGAGGHAGATGSTGGGPLVLGSGGEGAPRGGAPPSDADASASGGTPSADGGPCSRCLSSETCCDGRCVDRNTDRSHCGQCGAGCPGTVCQSASCTNQCAFGFIDCNRNVVDGCEVDAAQDPEHCGNCATACGFQQTCVQGTCRCPDLTANCDGIAAGNPCGTDLGSDPVNCGKCHQVCGANTACTAGKCTCAAGFADCNGQASDGCEASLTDGATCGSCNLDCGQHSLCESAGHCACAASYQDCDPKVAGCETSRADSSHCGSCSIVCTAPTPACSGTSCAVGCGALTLCGGSCVDTSDNPRNCGICNRSVGTNQRCVAGKPACITGFADCDSNPLDCEVDTRSDAAHCGTCALACKPGALCTNNACACSPGTPQDCGTSCKECCNDAQCEDGNLCTTDRCVAGKCASSAGCATGSHCCAGQACYECCGDADCGAKPGTVCTENQCQAPTCASPRLQCGASCVDPVTDAANCNGCGNTCGRGRGCAASSCAPGWVSLSSSPPGFVAREKAAYAAFGTKVFIWGGANAAGAALGDGAWYDTETDTWGVIGAASAPSPRILATAVWTGTVVVVWGGGDVAGTSSTASGARFNPVTNAWLPMSSPSGSGGPGGSLVPRRAPRGFWSGSRVLFWGGQDAAGKPLSGVDLYDPQNDTWTHGSQKDQAPALLDPAVGFTGSLLLLAGGQADGKGQSKHTYVYDASADAWSPGRDAPADRYGTLGTWDGTSLLSWSGSAGPMMTANDGARYSQTTDQWTSVTATGAPVARVARDRETGWSARASNGITLVLGGYGSPPSAALGDGGLYSSVTNTWTKVSAWPSGSAHLFGVGVLAGSEFVLWGGRTTAAPAAPLDTQGERFRP